MPSLSPTIQKFRIERPIGTRCILLQLKGLCRPQIWLSNCTATARAGAPLAFGGGG